MRRALILVAALALAVPAGAHAALFLVFDRATAHPGDAVRAYSATRTGVLMHAWTRPKGVTVYLVPVALPALRPTAAPSVVLTRPPRCAIRLGPLGVDRRGAFAISFRLPRVAAGDYTTAFRCLPCARGGDFFTSAYWGERWTGRLGPVLRVTR